MRQFCEDEGYDYNKCCKYAREGEKEKRINSEPATFVELPVEPFQPSLGGDIRIKEIRVRFTNGLMMSRRGNNLEDVLAAIRKIIG